MFGLITVTTSLISTIHSLLASDLRLGTLAWDAMFSVIFAIAIQWSSYNQLVVALFENGMTSESVQYLSYSILGSFLGIYAPRSVNYLGNPAGKTLFVTCGSVECNLVLGFLPFFSTIQLFYETTSLTKSSDETITLMHPGWDQIPTAPGQYLSTRMLVGWMLLSSLVYLGLCIGVTKGRQYVMSLVFWIRSRQFSHSESLHGDSAISMMALSKDYNNGNCCRARRVNILKRITLQIKRNEVIALAGRNGAGKSTLLKVISGEQELSSGYLNVLGNRDPSRIQSKVGYVRQQNCLWPQLSIFQHVALFSMIKGVPGCLSTYVIALLRQVDLEEHVNILGEEMSNGQCRRLEVALKVIGNPEVLILDEPTAGLDAIQSRHIWKMIQGIRRTSAIIFSTHSLDEAENIADRVIFLHQGEVKACDTVSALKLQYDDATLTNFEAPPTVNAATLRGIVDQIPNSTLLRTSISIPRSESSESKKSYCPLILSGVLEEENWKIRTSSLEDVFYKLLDADKPTEMKPHYTCQIGEFTPQVTFQHDGNWKQILAVFFKNIYFYRNRPMGIRIFCVFFFLWAIAIYFVMKDTLDHKADGLTKELQQEDQNVVFDSLKAADHYLCAPGHEEFCISPNFALGPQNDLGAWETRYWVTDRSNSTVSLLSEKNTSVRWQKRLEKLQESIASMTHVSWNASHYSTHVSSREITPNDRLEQSFSVIKERYLKKVPSICYPNSNLTHDFVVEGTENARRVFVESFPDVGIEIDQHDMDGTSVKFAFPTNDFLDGKETPFRILSKGNERCSMIKYTVNSIWYKAFHEILERNPRASKFFGDYSLTPSGISGTPVASSEANAMSLFASIVEAQNRLVFPDSGPTLGIVYTFYVKKLQNIPVFFFLIQAFYIMLIGLIYHPILSERRSGAIQFHRLNGLTSFSWWVGNTLFAFVILYVGTMGLSLLVACVISLESSASFFLIGILNGFAFIGLLFVLLALPLPYSSIRLLSFRIFIIIISFSSATVEQEEGRSFIGVLFPFFTYSRNLLGALLSFRIQWVSLLLATLINATYICASVYVISVGLNQIGRMITFPVAYLLRANIFPEFVIPLREFLSSKRGWINYSKSSFERSSLTKSNLFELDDVTLGHGKRTTLRNISLSIPRLSILGILGANSSGKSTLLKLLAGYISPSSGSVIVNAEETDMLGYCPQKDMVAPHSTVRENLQFFACIRGAPIRGPALEEAILQMATIVGIENVLLEKVKNLSGGMRRCLSLAVALIGSPSILLLDELSYSLDPLRRNQLFCVLRSWALERSTIIFTSQNPSEIGSMCSRFGMLTHGRLLKLEEEDFQLNNVLVEARYFLSLRISVTMEATPLLSDQQLKDAERKKVVAVAHALSTYLSPMKNIEPAAKCSYRILRDTAFGTPSECDFPKQCGIITWKMHLYCFLLKSIDVSDLMQDLQLMKLECDEIGWQLEPISLEHRLLALLPSDVVDSYIVDDMFTDNG
jgi:ABC-type multidrug transport system ATPase subunit